MNPFLVEGPAAISFSGGRTSGFMLWKILEAHGGKLPDDVRVLFANTGKEMPETLDFVQECSERWSVPITWVEYRPKIDGKTQHAVVTHETASRNGEPYEYLITDRSYLPNVVARFCTTELKIRPMHFHIRDEWGWDEWDGLIGLRADEPRRVARVRNRGVSTERARETMVMPLAEAGVAVAEVGQFWAAQDFDLRLPNMNGVTKHGNCDLCFLKGANQVLSLIREKPERALWWMAQERRIASAGEYKGDGARFRNDRPSYAEMYRMATEQQEMFPYETEAIEDCACTD